MKKINLEKISKKKIRQFSFTTLIIIAGSVIFKYIPMYIWGKDILFDASNHIMATSLGLYFIYLIFIEGKKKLKIPYFIFSIVAIILMGIQRIYANQHNTFGLMLGLIISLFAIYFPKKEKKRKNKK
jgi:hypothetical protein